MKTLLLLMLSIKCLESTPRVNPVVTTPLGQVMGMQAEDGDYTMYLAVPYAVVDQDNPFGDAQPHPGFATPYNATKDSALCPQVASGVPSGDLSCLNVNIYVPNTASATNKLPVMFYLPGGAFIVGGAARQNLGPKYLLRHDVIIVSANYRLGPYGFLCLDIPGYNNQGIRDQTLAIKWVKDNIESFGGDPNQITAFGQSAGAMTLDILLVVYEGLFNRVIMQSGASLSPWVFGKMNNSVPIHIAKELGFETSDVVQALNYLQTAQVSDVIRTANVLKITDHTGHPLTKPCVENPSDVSLISEHPVNLKPKVKEMDIMIGTSFREASFKYPDSDTSFYENYKFNEELDLAFNEVLDDKDVKTFYIGDKEPSLDTRHEILDFGSDIAFVHPVQRSIERYLDEGANSVYWYLFAYEGNRNRNRFRWNITSEGATHGDDLGYLWSMELFPDVPTDEDQKVIDVMTKLWTDFAKYGNPTPSGPTELIPVAWEPIKGEKRPYLLINSTLSLEARPFTKRMAFLDVYYKLHSDKVMGVSTSGSRRLFNHIGYFLVVFWALLRILGIDL